MKESFKNIAVFHTMIRFLKGMSAVAIIFSTGIAIALIISKGNWYGLLFVPVTFLFWKYLQWIWGDVSEVTITEENVTVWRTNKKIRLLDVNGVDCNFFLGVAFVSMELRSSPKTLKFFCTGFDYDLMTQWIERATRETRVHRNVPN